MVNDENSKINSNFEFQPIGENANNFTFLFDCQMAVFRLKGRPGLNSTFAELIGYSPGVTERPLALGAMVTFKTTEFYLVAKGDLLAVSQPLPSTKTTDPEPEPEQKRQRVGQQLGVGELPLTTGERAPYILRIWRGSNGERETKPTLQSDLRFGFRAVDPERWVHLMGGDWTLQTIEYSTMITERSRTRVKNRDPAFGSCGLLVRIEDLDFSLNSEKIKFLMTGMVCAGVGISIVISTIRGDIWLGGNPCSVSNCNARCSGSYHIFYMAG